MDESWIAAEDEINKAEHLGLPQQAVQDFLASGVHTRAMAWRLCSLRGLRGCGVGVRSVLVVCGGQDLLKADAAFH